MLNSKTFLNRLLMGSILVACVTPTFGEKVEQTEEAAFEVISAGIDPLYDGLLKFRKRGWLGADGATSVPLGEGKILWLFGDTILGSISQEGKRTGTIIRNSIGLHDVSCGLPGTVLYYWDLTDGVPGSFFMAENFEKGYCYWPLAGASVDGELFVFASQIYGHDIESFRAGNLHVLHYPNPLDSPTAWDMSITDLGVGGNHQHFCSAAYVEKPYIYLLGFDDGAMSEPAHRRMVLARAHIERLKKDRGREALEFWIHSDKGKIWAEEPDNLVTLFTPGVTETAVQFFPQWKQYCVITMDEQGIIYIVSAPSLTGPWSKALKIFEIPEMARNKDYFPTASKAHPELAVDEDELVITYVINTNNFYSLFTDPDIYYPRFVRVKLRYTSNIQ